MQAGLEVGRGEAVARAAEDAPVVTRLRRLEALSERRSADPLRRRVRVEECARARKGELPVVELGRDSIRVLFSPREERDENLTIVLGEPDELPPMNDVVVVQAVALRELRGICRVDDSGFLRGRLGGRAHE